MTTLCSRGRVATGTPTRNRRERCAKGQFVIIERVGDDSDAGALPALDAFQSTSISRPRTSVFVSRFPCLFRCNNATAAVAAAAAAAPTTPSNYGISPRRSDRMLKLCLDLRGFYLKSGQFLGTRHDFMPKIFLKKLG